jgi:hypothetical protein
MNNSITTYQQRSIKNLLFKIFKIITMVHSQSFTDSSRYYLVFFTDTVWIHGPHGQAISFTISLLGIQIHTL